MSDLSPTGAGRRALAAMRASRDALAAQPLPAPEEPDQLASDAVDALGIQSATVRPASDLESSPIFAAERGMRSVDNLPLEQYLAFGREIKRFQETHPDTLVRSSMLYSPAWRTGRITVRWWARGTAMPR